MISISSCTFKAIIVFPALALGLVLLILFVLYSLTPVCLVTIVSLAGLCTQESQDSYLCKSYIHLPTSPSTQITIATKKIAGAYIIQSCIEQMSSFYKMVLCWIWIVQAAADRIFPSSEILGCQTTNYLWFIMVRSQVEWKRVAYFVWSHTGIQRTRTHTPPSPLPSSLSRQL